MTGPRECPPVVLTHHFCERLRERHGVADTAEILALVIAGIHSGWGGRRERASTPNAWEVDFAVGKRQMVALVRIAGDGMAVGVTVLSATAICVRDGQRWTAYQARSDRRKRGADKPGRDARWQ